jgi:hypothetical protein
MHRNALLHAAIENNIGWCSVVCSSHGSNEHDLERLWLNRSRAPRYYPNIITRVPRAQRDVDACVEELRQAGIPGNWGIKDSFDDVDLSRAGFAAAIAGQWWASPASPARLTLERGWRSVDNDQALVIWEEAWGGDRRERIFTNTLLASGLVRFWALHRQGAVVAGFISYLSETALGLSNWFSKLPVSALELDIVGLARAEWPHMPVVLWATEDDMLLSRAGLEAVGPLRVWISERGSP